MAAQLSGKRRNYEGMKTNAWSHTYNLQVAVFFAGFFVVVFFAGLTGLALVCAAEEHAGIIWKAWARVCEKRGEEGLPGRRPNRRRHH